MKKKTTILLLAGSLMIAGIAALLYQSQNSRNQIRHYTAFFSTTGEEITSDNDMKKKIAEQIGADCEETWLKGQTKDNALNAYIAAGEYPDFISGESKLYDAGALIPIDEYWDNYPNIKNYLTEEQWDLFRQADGRTYLLDSTIRSFTGTGHGSNPQRRSFLDSDKSFEMGRLSGNHDGG